MTGNYGEFIRSKVQAAKNIGFEVSDDEIHPSLLDIHFRMLQWRELARAMGFPDTYEFCGTREQKVRQIGNAVEVNTAEALAMAAVS